MTITLNGRPATIEAGTTVADLLVARFRDPRPRGVAVAVNDEVARRDDWPRVVVADGDVVEIVTAVQGG